MATKKTEKPVTKEQAKKATIVLAKYSKQESQKALASGKKNAIKAGEAAKKGINKIKSFFK